MGATHEEPYSTEQTRSSGKRPKTLSAMSVASVSTTGRSVKARKYSISEWRCEGGCARRPQGFAYISAKGVWPMW